MSRRRLTLSAFSHAQTARSALRRSRLVHPAPALAFSAHEFRVGQIRRSQQVLVNNAGILGPRGPLAEVGNPSDLASVMDANVLGPIHLPLPRTRRNPDRAVCVAGPMLCCRLAEERMSTKFGGDGGAIVQARTSILHVAGRVTR